MARKYAELRAKMPEASRRAVDAEVRDILTKGMSLRDLRDACEITQVDLAKKMDTTQSEVSKIEQRADYLLSTLRGYIEGLGGELDLVARFPDGGEVRIRQEVAERVGASK